MKIFGKEHHQCDNPYEGAPVWAVELAALMILNLEFLTMTISPQVQAVLDKIQQNSDLVSSVDAGLKLQATQIADLQAQIAALQAQIAAGGTLSADDVTALATAASQLSDTNTKLQADVPANTTP